MGRGREATQRRPVDLDALREALADARAPRPRLQSVATDLAELVDYDARAARAWRTRARHGDVPDDPRRRRLILILIALAHLALLIALRQAMHRDPVPFTAPGTESVLEITFGEPEPPMTDVVAAPEEPVVTVDTGAPANVAAPVRAPAPAATPDPGMSVRFIDAEPAPTPAPIRLFNSDGSVLLSQDVIEAADAAGRPREPDFRTPPRELPEFMKHKRAISDERTRFEKYWVPDNENLGQQIVRKYPLAALILQGVDPPKCKARSIAPECEDQPLPQRFDDIIPNDVSEDPGIPR